MRRLVTIPLVLASLGLILGGCGKKEAATASTATAVSSTSITQTAASSSAAVATAPPVAADSTAAPVQEPSLVSISAGALMVQSPAEYDESWSAFRVLDENPSTGWATPKGMTTPQTMVIALPEKTVLNRLELDTASTDGEKRSAKNITVSVSDTSATDGFQRIADVTLVDKTDKQSFPVSKEVIGRWVKLEIRNNFGSQDYLELMDFRGYGKQLTQTPFPNVSGTYDTNYGHFHLQQEGTSVTGCYEHANGLLTGGIEGRVMKFTWSQDGPINGPALLVFDGTGQKMFGLWWNANETTSPGGIWTGHKISNDVGSCPNWSGKSGVQARMEQELQDAGRTRVYGINFDTDSDTIKDESKPTLDKISGVMKDRPEWKLTVEGHTDSSGDDAHNQQLSQKRADSVKTYLIAAGITADRLTAKGLGSSKPVADNANPSGRAENRRVELTKTP